MRIGDRKRAVLIGGEVSDGPWVGLIANEGDQLIYRVGVQVGERELELLAAAMPVTDQRSNDCATGIRIDSGPHHVRVELDVQSIGFPCGAMVRDHHGTRKDKAQQDLPHCVHTMPAPDQGGDALLGLGFSRIIVKFGPNMGRFCLMYCFHTCLFRF